jgi:4-aminobutyrate aminotransferase-like enzyme
MNVAQLSQILKQATGVVAARGEGVLLYDEDDRRYLDFTAGIGVTIRVTATRGWSKPRSDRSAR